MKKLLSLALAILMLCTLFLTSCSDKRSDDEIMEDIVKNSKRTALTLSVMIPTDADTSSPEFQERLAAVEEAINTLLRQDCTEIKLIAVNDAEYDAAVAKKMSDSKASIAAGGSRPSSVVFTNQAYKKYVNGVDGEYTIQLKYPDIMENQVDIILIRDKEDYVNYVNNGQLRSLKNYLASSGSYYRITKIIKPEILSMMEVNGAVYGIPNNHLYSNGLYQYLVIDKSVANQIKDFDVKTLTDANGKLDYVALGAFLEDVAELDNVLPLVAKEGDAPTVSYWGEDGFSLISSSMFGNKAPVGTLENRDYTSFMSLYKKYNVADDGKSKVAVTYDYLSPVDVEEDDDHYYVRTEVSVINDENAFESVFAVTSYSVEFDRAMEFVYNLQTDEEIRTLLQYGIKGEDYQLENGVLEMIKDNKGDYAYKMNTLYTGNGYITYPAENVSIDMWDYIKDINYDSIVNPYEGLNNFYAENNKDKIDACTAALKTLNASAYEKISNMTAEEFDTFVAEWAKENTENADVLEIRNSDAYKNAIAAYTELYNAFAGVEEAPAE